MLRKPGKGDYTIPKAYKLIALLNSLRKVLELVIARKISALSKTFYLFLESQISARKG